MTQHQIDDAHLSALVTGVALYYRVSVREIMGRRRGNLCCSRQLAMRLVKDRTQWSLPTVGAMFNRDHTTVLHALTMVERRYDPEELTTIVGHVDALAKEILDGKSEVDAVLAVERARQRNAKLFKPDAPKPRFAAWEWLSEDDDYIIKHFDSKVHADLALDIGCTSYELSRRKVFLRGQGRIGVSRNRGAVGVERVKQKVDWKSDSPGRPWGKFEDGLVIAHAFKGISADVTCKQLVGRSRCAVLGRQNRLREGGILQCENQVRKGRRPKKTALSLGAGHVLPSADGRPSPLSRSVSINAQRS